MLQIKYMSTNTTVKGIQEVFVKVVCPDHLSLEASQAKLIKIYVILDF